MDRFNLPEREGHCAYGKFFARKAGFVSREWLPDLANCLRSRPLAPNEDAAALDDVVLQTILAEGTATVRELRRTLGFARGRGKRAAADPASEVAEEGKIPLDPILTRLQMEMRLVIADFEYSIDRHGNRYGWGIARYTIHDTRNAVRSAPHRAHARRIVRAHLRTPPPSFSRRCGRQPAENHRRFPGGVTPQPYHGAPRPVRGSAAPRLRAYVFPAGRTRTGAQRLIPAASCILPATWSHRTEGGPGTDRKRRLTATGRPRPGTRAGNGIRSGKERRAGCDPTREAAASS